MGVFVIFVVVQTNLDVVLPILLVCYGGTMKEMQELYFRQRELKLNKGKNVFSPSMMQVSKLQL